MSERPLFLLSNDDGYRAEGIKALAEVVSEFGDVYVVAPRGERSAASYSITLANPLRVRKVRDRVYALEGTPVDCALFGLRVIVPRRPVMVISGINKGANVSIDTLYSGTVGAAMEACIEGYPAMAVSLVGTTDFDYAASAKVVRILLNNRELLVPAKDGVLNVNVPDIPYEQIKGFSVAGIGHKTYDEVFDKRQDPRGKTYYWLGGGGTMHRDVPDSDCVSILDGYVSMSVLRPSLLDEKANSILKTNVGSVLSDAL